VRLLLTGTGTGVGKTWAGARLAAAIPGAKAWKPAQSFAPEEGSTDAEVLAAATGQAPHEVCPPHRWYPVPLAPPEACHELGLPPFTVADLVAEMPSHDGPLLVEGAGGPRSPLAADGDTVSLAEALQPSLVVLVGHAGLGAINHVRLAAAALEPWPLLVFLNRFDPGDRACVRNDAFLRGAGFDVVTDIERLLHVAA
jgi:dethiobiotin synthetase